MATEKQLRFFVSLREELGLAEDQEAVEAFSGLPVKEASAKIDELLEQRLAKQGPAKEEPQQGSSPFSFEGSRYDFSKF